VGYEVAMEVSTALEGLTWMDEPELWLKTHRTAIDRKQLGYGADEFPFEYGGVYCNVNEDLLDCDPETDLHDFGLDELCVGFPAEYPAPMQTVISAGQIGPLAMVTFPGEPGTLLAESVIDEIRADGEEGSILFMGYAQDYIGYSILEDDWWQGGYEASGALWGPRQGSYLASRAVEVFNAAHGVEELAYEEPGPVAPFEAGDFTPYVATEALERGTVLTDVAGEYGPTEVISMTVAGSDPWLGTPVTTLLNADGEVVSFDNGAAFQSHTMGWWIEVDPVPSYKEDREAEQRRFEWTVSLPAQRAVEGVSPALNGMYQLEMVIPTEDGEQVVRSGLFGVNTEGQ